MLAFVAIFVPSIIGLKLVDYYYQGLSNKRCIYYYSFLLLFSLIINSILVNVLFGLDKDMIKYLNFHLVYFAIYSFASIIINIIIAFVIIVVKEKVTITLEVQNNDKSIKTVINNFKRRNNKNN